MAALGLLLAVSAESQDLLTRIREHLREYVSQLPDYTCRVTIERSTRRGRAPFELTDRLRLEVAYTGGNELYAWPGSAAFERSIEELLPAHGMVSNGSYALHMRTLFVRNVARFSEPHTARGQVAIDFTVPAVLSGYALGTGAGSVPAGLAGTVTVDAATLDLAGLEVRIDTRLGQTVEKVTYTRADIGGVEFVIPQTAELILTDGALQLRNRSRFDDYHRYAGTATLRFDEKEPRESKQAAVSEPAAPAGAFTATIEGAIGEDAAIGDQFIAVTEGGAKLTGRITDMRRSGKDYWNIELTLAKRSIRKTVRLPVPAGWKIKWPQMNADERR